MFQVAIPQNESRVLVNSMEASQTSKSSEEADQCFCHSYLGYLDIRNSTRIESAKQDIYIDIVCNLFNDSVQYNDSKHILASFTL